MIRLAALLLVLGACDRVFGLGDPYEDARPIASGSDAAIDTATEPVDVIAVLDATALPIPLIHFPFDANLNTDQGQASATCMSGRCDIVATAQVGAGSVLFSQNGCAKVSLADTPSAFSLALWIRAGSTTEQTLISRAFDSTSPYRVWWLHGTSTAITFTTYDGSGAVSVPTAAKLTTGVWQHLAVTYDGTTLQVFDNTQPVASQAAMLVPGTDPEFYVGCNAAGSGYFTGYVDDLYVFDHALTSDELAAVYAQ